MRETKLIVLLKTLNDTEIKNFEKFIHSPYFNTNKNVIRFWKYLKKYAPDYDSSKLERNKIYKKLFPNEVYDDGTLRQLRSLLFKSLQRFLVIEQLKIQEQESDLLLAKVYQRKKLFAPLNKLVTKNLASSSTEQKLVGFYQKTLWNKKKYHVEKESKMAADATPIKKIDESLDLYYIGSKLKYACELESWNKIMNTTYTTFLVETLLAKSYGNKSLPVFHRLYASALTMIQNSTKDNFESFRDSYYETAIHLEKEDRAILLTYLLNFTFFRIHQHDNIFLKEAFQLYQFGIDQQLFIINDVFLADHLTNLIALASTLRAFEWIDDFLETLDKMKNLGSLTLDASSLSLAKGRVAFEKGDYLLSLDYLAGISTKNQFHSYGSRYISIACYVELNYPAPFINTYCNSFIVFVNRRLSNKVEIVEGAKNFVWVVKELVKDTPNKEKLLTRLQSNVKFIFKKWLERKVDSLE